MPALLQASLFSLMSAAIPLETVYATATKSLSSSYHVFAFDSQSRMIFNESEGDFSLDEWDAAYDQAERECADSVEGLRKGWKR